MKNLKNEIEELKQSSSATNEVNKNLGRKSKSCSSGQYPGKSGNKSRPQPNCRKRRNEEAKTRTNGEISDENNENEDNYNPAAAIRTRIASTTGIEVDVKNDEEIDDIPAPSLISS